MVKPSDYLFNNLLDNPRVNKVLRGYRTRDERNNKHFWWDFSFSLYRFTTLCLDEISDLAKNYRTILNEDGSAMRWYVRECDLDIIMDIEYSAFAAIVKNNRVVGGIFDDPRYGLTVIALRGWFTPDVDYADLIERAVIARRLYCN